MLASLAIRQLLFSAVLFFPSTYALSAPVTAQNDLYVFVTGGSNVYAGPVAYRDPISGQAQISYSTGAIGYSGNAFGYSDYGVLKARTIAIAGEPFSSNTASITSWQDSLEISSPFAQQGSTGFAEVSAEYFWGLGTSGYATATAVMILAFNGGAGSATQEYFSDNINNIFTATKDVVPTNPRTFTSQGPNYFTVLAEFRFGVPFGISQSLSAYSGAYGQPNMLGSAATVIADNSVYWGGISAIYDSNGTRLFDYSLDSATGIDYSRSFNRLNVVSEPGTIILVLTGFAVFALRSRSRKIVIKADRNQLAP